MCGINGIISFGNSKIVDVESRLSAMNKSISHRGPDNEGVLINKNFALGHLRLSIIDIDQRSNQPMTYKGHHLVFNGEIFNYKEIKDELAAEFNTDSDTEVVLVAIVEKGLDWFLNRANGFFAFVLVNVLTTETMLVRDRFGIKPLFYSWLDDVLIFSSEIKGILNSGIVETSFRQDKIEEYLRFRFVLEPDTFFSNIFQLESATYQHINNGTTRAKKYWELPKTIETNILPESEILKELDARVKESIDKWAITDVPLGSFLSGGLDSSLTSAILADSIDNLKTFTIGYDVDGYNEFSHADKVAKHIGSDHIVIRDDLHSYVKNWDYLIQMKDAPLAVPNEIPLAAMCQELAQNVTVVISGEGADELFGGYGRIYRLPFDFSQSDDLSFKSAFLIQYSYVGSDFLTKYFNGQSKRFEEVIHSEYASAESDLDFIFKFFHNVHIKGLLSRVDMTSMQASVEARPVFLDHELVEYVYKNIPNSLKIKWKGKLPPKGSVASDYSEVLDIPKYVLKKVAEQYLPKDIVYRKKMGFPVPLDDWFESLKNDFDINHPVFNEVIDRNIETKEFLEDLRKENRQGQILWMLLNLQKFYNNYFNKSWKW